MAGAGDTARSSIDGKYRVVELLGADDQVERYLAEHTAIRRPVEVHCLRPNQPADGEAAARLVRTARALGGATHRNLQSVVDSGRDREGRPYIVFEALRGAPLRALLRGEPMESRRAAKIAVQLLEALRALHDAGVVLRCLTPDDLLVESVSAGDELVKIRGVQGAAMMIDGGAEPVRVTGYTAYLAPELRRGDSGLDPRVDLYSAGVILREMSTGAARGDTGPLGDTARRAIARACAEDPDERFANADGFLQAVALLLPTTDRPPASRCPLRRTRCRPICSTCTCAASRGTARGTCSWTRRAVWRSCRSC